MGEEFAASRGLSRTPLKQKYELKVFDGADGALSGAVTDLVVGEMVIDQHTETQASFFLYQTWTLSHSFRQSMVTQTRCDN